MLKLSVKFLLFVIICSGLTSCKTLDTLPGKNNSVAVDQIEQSQLNNKKQKKSPISVDQALSTISIEQTIKPTIVEDRFDVSVKDVEINSFLLGLVDATEYNLLISPKVKMRISLQLKNVTIIEVLDALTKIYPIIVEQKDNLFLISSAETMTLVYTVDYLNIKRKGKSLTSVAGQPVGGGSGSKQNNRSSDSTQSSSSNSTQQTKSSSVETKTETDFWSELTKSLNLIIKNEEKANVVVSPHVGIVVVRALPKTQALIKRYLSSTQNSLNRQVIIEAKIIEVRLNEGFQSGIDWSKMGTSNGDIYTLGQSGQVLQQKETNTPLNGIFSLLYNGNSFSAAIELLKSQGNVQVLSSPRVSTVNNQKAIIKVGSDEFFVTDVSTTTVTGTSTATTPNVTLTPFFSGISLDVTPQVSQHGDIILHIHPIVSEVTDQPKTLSLGTDSFVLPLALSNVRESDSIVKTRSGRVVVIGGLMQNTIQTEDTSTPLLGDIPLMGNLFKQKRQFQIKSELVILLRAHLVNINENQQQLEQVKSRFGQF